MPIKALSRSTVLTVMLVLFGLSLSAQWQQLNFPQGGGKVFTVERINDELWAGTPLGIYISTDEGLNWTLSDKFSNKKVYRIESYSDTIIVLYKQREEFLGNPIIDYLYCQTSFDGGQSWQLENSVDNFEGIGWYNSTFNLKRYGNRLYLFGSIASYFSLNFGLTWNVFINNFPNDIETGTFDDGGFTYTTPGSGANYELKYRQLPVGNTVSINTNNIAIQNISGKIENTIFSIVTNETTFENNLVRTSDWGQSWDTIYGVSNLFDPFFAKFILYSDTLYYFTQNAQNVIKICDGGNTIFNGPLPEMLMQYFNSIAGLLSNYDYFDYTMLNDGNYIATNPLMSFTPFHIYNNNYQFAESRGSGINNAHIRTFKKMGNQFAISANNQTYFSDSLMVNWDTLNNAIRMNNLIKGDSLFYAIEGNSGSYYLRRSYNEGSTFSNINFSSTVNSSFQSGSSELSMAVVNNTLYLEGGNGIFRSLTWGNTWLGMPTWPTQFDSVVYTGTDKGYLFPFNGEILLAVSSKPLILRLNPSNNNWSFFAGFSQNANSTFHKLVYKDSFLISMSSNHFMFSADEGIQWNFPAMQGLPAREDGEKIYPTSLMINNSLWFGTFHEFGIYYSADRGNNWIPLDLESRFTVTGDLFLRGDTLFAASINGGMWKRKIHQISGTVFQDVNDNGIQEPGENGIPNMPIKSYADNRIIYTNPDGFYTRILTASTDTFEVMLDLDYVNVSMNPQEINSIQSIYNFPVVLSPYTDLSINLTVLNVFRPGFQTHLQLTGQNRGNENSIATIKLLIPEHTTLISANPNFSSQTGDTLVWNTPELTFFEQYTIQLSLQNAVNAPLGDSVFCYAQISPVNGDSLPENNAFIWEDIFVGAYDPNDKRCIQGDEVLIERINDDFELHYLIRFQNTGTYEAENVWIADQLSPLLDWSSLRIIDQSHEPMLTEIDGDGMMRLYFNNIQLPDSFANEPLSHGFVKYGIKPRQGIQVGNVISNTAGIYFDFNEPIITNTVNTEITEPIDDTGLEAVLHHENSLIVFPNPAQNSILIHLDDLENQPVWIAIFDLSGRRVMYTQVEHLNNPIPIATFSRGMYQVILMNQAGKKLGASRFVRE